MRPAVRAAAARLRVDSAAAEVLRAFDAAGVQSILLKGASNHQWLGDRGEAPGYVDCDLLVRPGDEHAAGRVLTELGFVAELDAARMPQWWREHGVAWARADDLATIDLHRTLPGVAVDDRRVWQLLSPGAERLVVGDYSARALAIPGRAVHVALHAAHHGPSNSASLTVLRRALERVDEGVWRAAAALADDLGALDAFHTGLRLVPAGQLLAARLGIETGSRVEVALVGERSRAPAVSIERFAATNDLRTRLSMIRHKLFPPKTFIHLWSPLGRRGRAGLFAAYAWRPVWVLLRVPAAVRAWRRARGKTRSD